MSVAAAIRGGGKAFRRRAVVCTLALVMSLGVADTALAASSQSLDIEFAVDTTGSMGPSIEQAKRDGRRIVEEVKRLLPDARFAVVAFRDYQNPAGEYDVLQPLTGDVALVDAALEKLRVASNPLPGNVAAESYNLVFRNSYADATLGWRADSRKLVIVVGDAQPHGAGSAGIPGCDDTTRDPHGLNTAAELQAMRAAKRTLILVRQVSPQTTVSLQCYESLAQRAYVGGGARDGGSADLPALILDLVQAATAPVRVTPDLPLALRGGTNGVNVSVVNPGRAGITVTRLAVVLPRGFRYIRGSTTGAVKGNPAVSGRTLSWAVKRELSPSARLAFHFRVKASQRLGRYSVAAFGEIAMPNGTTLTSRSRPGAIRVVRRLAWLKMAFRGSPSAGSGAVIRGSATTSPARGRRTRPSGPARGSVTLAVANGRSLALQVRSYRLVAFGAMTKLQFHVRVRAARGMPGCAGASGVLTVTNSGSLLANGRATDSVAARFGGRCAATTRWSNAAARRADVAVTLR
ncbi:MAG: VWA domain-containing protein [Thermoleophilia bacterium]|nr:VWA domain-containing protein [Thermoleophilia bacterium]